MKGIITSEKRVLEFKEEIAGHVADFVRASGVEQKTLSKKLGIDPTLLSQIMKNKLDAFTIDRLLKFLGAVRPDLVPALKKKRMRKVK